MYQVHIPILKIPSVIPLYRSELRVLERRQKNRLIRNLVAAFAEEVIYRLEDAAKRIADYEAECGAKNVVTGTPRIESFAALVESLSELLTDRKREQRYWAETSMKQMLRSKGIDAKGLAVLDQIDDEVADLVRKFRRAACHSKKFQTYPKTFRALRAIQRKVRHGWFDIRDTTTIEETR